VWDFTCRDTLATSYLHRALIIAACTVAVDAEDRKRAKYTALCDQYCFVPLTVETLGALGEEAATFFRDIGRRIAVAAGEPRSPQFLFQRLNIAIQRGNRRLETRDCRHIGLRIRLKSLDVNRSRKYVVYYSGFVRFNYSRFNR